MITDLEPDILECEVKWALESITMNKASGGDGFPVDLFQILKDDAVKVLNSICQRIWKTQRWPQDWKRSVFIPIPKKGNAKECSNYRTIALISHASKVMLKILQARLQQYVNCELPDVQAGFRKGRGTRDQIANIRWIMEKAREFQKNIYFCFIDYAKAFDCVDHNKLWEILKEMGIPDHLTCLAVQGTLNSLLQHHSSKASILGCSAFFVVQLSHPYMTTGKTTALAIQTFIGKVMSLLFNTLSRFVIVFLLRSKHLFPS